MNPLHRLYYTIKPAVPRKCQIFLRRYRAQFKLQKSIDIWPIDPSAAKTPEGWRGWPGGKQFCFALMHDVDTQDGHDKCHLLMDLEERLGIRSVFYFVPEKYKVSTDLLRDIRKRGFDFGVHGLRHDGKLFASKKIFLESAKQINHHLAKWNVDGFSAPSMLSELGWMNALNIRWATSTFDTDPFEPQPEGVKTVFPFWVQSENGARRYLELPYTLPQDFTLFIILRYRTFTVWMKKLNWIAENGGMVLLNTHPDYMCFNRSKMLPEEYPASYYADFIREVQTRYENRFWHACPAQITHYFAAHSAPKKPLLI